LIDTEPEKAAGQFAQLAAERPDDAVPRRLVQRLHAQV
jgi:hypothetical protein